MIPQMLDALALGFAAIDMRLQDLPTQPPQAGAVCSPSAAQQNGLQA